MLQSRLRATAISETRPPHTARLLEKRAWCRSFSHLRRRLECHIPPVPAGHPIPAQGATLGTMPDKFPRSEGPPLTPEWWTRALSIPTQRSFTTHAARLLDAECSPRPESPAQIPPDFSSHHAAVPPVLPRKSRIIHPGRLTSATSTASTFSGKVNCMSHSTSRWKAMIRMP